VSKKPANAVEERIKASRVLKGASLRSQPNPRKGAHDGLTPTAKVNARFPVVIPVACAAATKFFCNLEFRTRKIQVSDHSLPMKQIRSVLGGIVKYSRATVYATGEKQ
jgi:hypothetical protein